MISKINGNYGFYDNIIKDKDVRYGRNAVSNYSIYMMSPFTKSDFSNVANIDKSNTQDAFANNLHAFEEFADKNEDYLESLPPLEFEYRYMPEGGFNSKALMGAAFEDMGDVEISVDDFEQGCFLGEEEMTAEPIDINKDGKIDLAEYSTTILAADVLSKGNDISKVDGTINSTGMNAVLEYSKKSKAAAAAKLYSDLYNTYGLNDSYKQFLSDSNNVEFY